MRAATGPVVASLAMSFSLGVATAGLGAALPAIQSAFRLGSAASGTAVGAYGFGALAAILLFGFVFQQTRTVFTALVACVVAGCLGMAWSPVWAGFLGAAVFAGVGYGGLILCLNAVFVRWADRRGVFLLSLLHAIYGVGAVVGPLIVGWLERYTFLLVAVAAVLCGPLRGLAGSAGTESGAEPSVEPQGKTGGRARFLAFASIAFVYAGVETGIGTWESSHLTGLGYASSAAAQLTALFWGGLAVGRLAIPLLSRRLSSSNLILVCLVLAAAVLPLAMSASVAPVAYALTGLFIGPVFPALLMWLTRTGVAPQQGIAGVLVASMAGGVVFPQVIGVVVGVAGTPAIPVAVALVAAAVLAVAFPVKVRLARATR
ncbi:MFS transporter [Rhizohabitans arisaemae]|uniref:MFS transporter n=1 Tax=Rhizohabitans arisaemae TaxID=2720610 RepID=UPI0024B1F31A|nr:MFS transporter [Rhizohabitans arisaemae]